MTEKVQQLREQYPKGCRIEYLGVNDFLTTIPSGTKGTVEGVDRHGNILMKWDNGSTLPLIPKSDSFRKYEPPIAQLGDDCKIILPDKPVDCSRLGFFDELEEDCWSLVKNYCAALGIEMVAEDGEIPISFDIAKDIQDGILGKLQEAGVELDFDGINESEDNTPAMRM